MMHSNIAVLGINASTTHICETLGHKTFSGSEQQRCNIYMPHSTGGFTLWEFFTETDLNKQLSYGTIITSMILVFPSQDFDLATVNCIADSFKFKSLVIVVDRSFLMPFPRPIGLSENIYDYKTCYPNIRPDEKKLLNSIWGYNGVGTFKLSKTTSEKQESNILVPIEQVQGENLKSDDTIQMPTEPVQVEKPKSDDNTLNFDILSGYLDCIWTNDRSSDVIHNLKKSLYELYYKKEHMEKLNLIKNDDRIKNAVEGIQEILKHPMDSAMSVMNLRSFLLDFGLKTHF